MTRRIMVGLLVGLGFGALGAFGAGVDAGAAVVGLGVEPGATVVGAGVVVGSVVAMDRIQVS